MSIITGTGTLTGTENSDFITGTGGDTTVTGLDGNDVIRTGSPPVFVDAAAGNNTIATALDIDDPAHDDRRKPWTPPKLESVEITSTNGGIDPDNPEGVLPDTAGIS